MCFAAHSAPSCFDFDLHFPLLPHDSAYVICGRFLYAVGLACWLETIDLDFDLTWISTKKIGGRGCDAISQFGISSDIYLYT